MDNELATFGRAAAGAPCKFPMGAIGLLGWLGCSRVRVLWDLLWTVLWAFWRSGCIKHRNLRVGVVDLLPSAHWQRRRLTPICGVSFPQDLHRCCYSENLLFAATLELAKSGLRNMFFVTCLRLCCSPWVIATNTVQTVLNVLKQTPQNMQDSRPSTISWQIHPTPYLVLLLSASMRLCLVYA